MKNKELYLTSFIGSKNIGKCLEIVSEIEKRVEQEFQNITINHLKNTKIEICKGCKLCVRCGRCPISDDVDEIKESLLKSNIIIFSTPVYVKNVSGLFKNLLDRLLSWYHTMPLSGKIGIVVICTYNTGVDDVAKYLYEVLSSLGITIISFIVYQDIKKTNIDAQINQLINTLYKIFYYDKTIYCSEITENMFKAYNTVYRNMVQNNSINYELSVWVQKGYINYDSLDEYLSVQRQIK